MAATTAASSSSSPSSHDMSRLGCVKVLAESPNLNTIPSNYTFTENQLDHQSVAGTEVEASIPIIDFSLLNSSDTDQRSKVIQDLGNACKDWGFFMVINHGVEGSLMERAMDAIRRFFELPEEEKKEFAGKHVLDPIRCGTSFNASVEKVLFWRDFLKFFVHPEFHSPNKPTGFSEIAKEYCERTREVARELLKGISESLGLESGYIDRAMNMDSGFQIMIANLYPPCPQPDLALGMPPHSDHGLLTLLTQNGIGGLQLQHNGKWVNVNAIPNSFLVNTGDHVEILSNGRYKSVVHRVVNNKSTRTSLAIAHGPALDTVVSPAQELINGEGNAPTAYIGMKYREYMLLQQSNQLDNKSVLDRVRI